MNARAFILMLFMVAPAFFFFVGARATMANDSNTSSSQSCVSCVSWWMSWSGGLEYGNPREVSFDGDRKFYFGTADTANSNTRIGVGVFELNLQNSDLADARYIGELLCGKNIQSDSLKRFEPEALFTATCVEDGKRVKKYGSIQLIPDDIAGKMANIWTKLSDKALKDGRKVIKLDYSTDKVEYKDGHFVVSVRFINSGNQQIKFKTPDQWVGSTFYGDRLGVGSDVKVGENGKLEKSSDSAWSFGMEGQKLLNRDEFSGGVVTLNSGEAKVLRFQTTPDFKATKGEYEFSGVVFMHIMCEGKWWNQSTFVDFKPIKTRIKIDRDYPSTPAERKQWEAKHRADMSSQPVKPGEKFAEDGLYRAVRLLDDANYRGLLLKQFSAGDVATTEDVRMPMEQHSEYNINGPVQWVWEGEAPQLNGPLYSSGYVEGTQHSCRPGANCPRSGRWVLRTRAGLDYRYDLSRIIPLNQGQPMPSVRSDAGDAEWEWVGPLA